MISKSQIKFIRSLHRRKFREQHQSFIIEGTKVIKEAIHYSPLKIEMIFGTEQPNFKLPENIDFHQISNQDLQKISALKHPQRYIAVCKYIKKTAQSSQFYIALDTIQDPGNMGTILRLASWFGINDIVASKETVDVYNPKVVQASMGAIFNISINYTELKSHFKSIDLPIYGALLNGENLYVSKREKKGVLLMGNEGNGISEELLPYITHPITIPRFGHGESLNVAIAAGIILSEFSRHS